MNDWIVLLITLSAFSSATLLFYISHLIRDINLRQAQILKKKAEHINLTYHVLNEVRDTREVIIKTFYEAHRGKKE